MKSIASILMGINNNQELRRREPGENMMPSQASKQLMTTNGCKNGNQPKRKQSAISSRVKNEQKGLKANRQK